VVSYLEEVNAVDGPTAQTDEEFRQSMERCTMANDAFRHRDHLRLAWIYLRESDLGSAMRRLSQSIKRYAQPSLERSRAGAVG
jgi:hypothetical protein